MTSPGIYLAYPTTPELKPIYPCYKTLVNGEHTKLGIARRSFHDRERQYMRTFQGEVLFHPVLEMAPAHLSEFEARVLAQLTQRYPKSGRAREWFHTAERQAIAELVMRLHQVFHRGELRTDIK